MSRSIPISLSLLLVACPVVAPSTGTVEGTVEALSGTPLVGADVRLDADHVTTTDADGRFSLELPVASLSRVRVAAAGHVTVARRVDVLGGQTTSVRFVLAPEATAIRVDAVEAGFEVVGERGAGLTAPAAAFVHADGTPATGPVDVVLTPFDPSVEAELDAFPGDLRGIRLGGSEVMLESWGVVDAVVRQDGEVLEVADGQTVTLRIPPPGDDRTEPDTVATWYFDEDEAAWMEVGEASFDAADGVFVAEVPHLSPYNCDRPFVPGCIRGIVRDARGDGIGGAYLTVFSDPRGTMSSDFTDLDGYFCLYVERNSELTIQVRTPIRPGDDSCPAANRQGGWCLTTRTASSGAAGVSGAYPTSCNAQCTVITPSIEIGAPDPGPAACELPASDPFAGPCADVLTSIFTCWAPMGACEYVYEEGIGDDVGTTTVEYENGARAESGFDPFSGWQMIYTNGSGVECGRAVSSLFGGLEYRTPGGRAVAIDVTPEGTTVARCDGVSEVLDASQLDTLAACAPAIAGMPGATPSGVGACRPREGTIGGRCRSGAFCDADYECCSRVGDEPTCQPNGLCEALCDGDEDCTAGTICCQIGGYAVCADPRGCT